MESYVGQFLIGDSQTAARVGLTQIIRAEFPEVRIGEETSSAGMLERVRQSFWRLAIFDLTLPEDGLGLIASIKGSSPPTQILIHTARPDDPLVIQALRNGADGFVARDAPREEIIHAMKKVLSGARYINSDLGEFLARQLATELDAPLSEREFQILRWTASGRTLKDISSDLGLSIKTVSDCRSRIRVKLHLQSTAELIRYGVERKLS
jgi:DNA-binding NarL/FixJ family response regulator